MRRLWVLVALAASVGSARAAREELVPGHLVVRWKEHAAQRPAPSGARLERHVGAAIHLLHAVDDSEVGTLALMARLAADPDVAWVEREHYRRRSDTPVDVNDTLFSQQWSLTNTQITLAWSRWTGSPQVVVAVVDSGIQPHPDLQGRYLQGYDFITDPDAAADGDGRDPDPTDEGDLSDSSSGLHGMHVAGIVGAHVNNATGIAGVDWRCMLLPVRVLDVHGGRGTDTDIADGIRWAAGVSVEGVPDNPNPASVINLSFGGPGGSGVIQAAIDEAWERRAIIVAAAGNDSSDTAGYAPAGLNHVVAVGAVDSSWHLASYSNFGPRVDVMAPGGDLATGAGILSTVGSLTLAVPFNYEQLAGTSQAAPHVSGVAALMKAVYPKLQSDDARAMFRYHANPDYQCAAGCGGGLLDAYATIAAAEEACRAASCQAPGTDVVGGGCRVARGRDGAGSLALVLLALAIVRRRSRR
jgi:serine protease